VCGLYGLLNRGVSKERAAIFVAILAHANDDRGGHSWGVYLPESQRIIKGLGKAVVVDGGLDAVQISDQPVVLGHARMATHGDKTIENAHPFVIEAPERTIVGAHNGVLSNHDELNKQYERNFAVDSMHIFAHIAEDLPLTEISGYGAITYMTSEYDDNRVYLGRFNGGSLAVFAIGSVKEPLGLVWSSLPTPIELAAKLAALPIERYQIEENKLYYARADGLYVTDDPFAFGKRVYTTTSTSGRSYGGHSYGWTDDERYPYANRLGRGTTAVKPPSSHALDKARDAIIGDEDDTLPPRPTTAADRQLALVGRNGDASDGASAAGSSELTRVSDDNLPFDYLTRKYPYRCEICQMNTYASQAMIDEDFIICEICADDEYLCRGCGCEVDAVDLEALKLDPSEGDPILCQYCLTAWIFYSNEKPARMPASSIQAKVEEEQEAESTTDDTPSETPEEALDRRLEAIADDDGLTAH
jgi:hypothetical protein